LATEVHETGTITQQPIRPQLQSYKIPAGFHMTRLRRSEDECGDLFQQADKTILQKKQGGFSMG